MCRENRSLCHGSSASSPLFPLLSRVLLGTTLIVTACSGGDGSGGDDGVDAGGGTVDGGGGGGADASSPDGSLVFEQAPLIEGLTTLAGYDYAGSQDGDREHALFNNPVNVVVSPDGDLIVADFDNSLIRRVTPAGDVTTLNLAPAPPGVFSRPFGLVITGDSVLIQTDGDSLGYAGPMGPAAIWSMPLEGGSPVLKHDMFGRCRGMVELPDGKIAMAFYQQHVVQVYDRAAGTLTPLAGVADTPGYRDGTGTAARFDGPYDLILLADGSLLVSDWGNNRLRTVDLDGHVGTFAGTGAAGNDDGARAAATFDYPQGLALDAAGNIYVTDTLNYRVRRIALDGQVTTVAGTGAPGYRDDADPMSGELYGLEGADVGPDGYLYITDGSRGETAPFHRVRRLTIE